MLQDLGGSQSHCEAEETDIRLSSRNDSQNHTPNWPTKEADASAKIRKLEIQKAVITGLPQSTLRKEGIISFSFVCLIQFLSKVFPRCVVFIETKLNVSEERDSSLESGIYTVGNYTNADNGGPKILDS